MGTIIIKKYQCQNEKLPKCYKKWYGKVMHRGTLDINDVAKHMMGHGTIFTDDVVIGVTRKLMHCIAEMITDGYKVKLDGIGTLYLAATSVGVDHPDEFDNERHIKRIGVKFLADQSHDSIFTARMMKQNTSLTTKIGNTKVSFGEQEESGDDETPGGAIEDQP